MNRLVLLLLGFFATFALLSGAFQIGRAQADDAGVASIVPAAPDGSAAAAAPTAHPAPQLQASDLGVAEKAYKNGSFFALGIIVVFVGLTIWSKLDKKHAFYISVAIGGVGMLVESIRRGETPNATSLLTMLYTTGGILIAGPNHAKVTPG